MRKREREKRIPKEDKKYAPGTLICWTKTMNKLKKYLPNLTFDCTMADYKIVCCDQCQAETGKNILSNSYIGIA